MWRVLTVLIGLDGNSMYVPTAKIRWKQEIIVLAAVRAFLVTVGCCSKADSKRVKPLLVCWLASSIFWIVQEEHKYPAMLMTH